MFFFFVILVTVKGNLLQIENTEIHTYHKTGLRNHSIQVACIYLFFSPQN